MNASGNRPNELLGLLAAYCDDLLSSETRDQLNERLRIDAAAREMFVDYLDQHAQLHWTAPPPAGSAAEQASPTSSAGDFDSAELALLKDELRELSRADHRAGVMLRRNSQRNWMALTALVVAIAAVALWWQPGRSDSPELLSARLAGVEGDVHLRGADTSTATSGVLVFPGQSVRTGEFGVAHLIYADGTAVVIQNDSQLTLENSSNGQKRLRLERGFAELRVVRQSPGAPLLLATPQSTIRVLGTQFRAWASERETRIEMDHGRVEVTRQRDAAKVEAVAGTVTIVDETATPLVTQRLPPQRGKPRLKIEEGTGPLVAIAFSPGGETIASSSWKEETKLWNVATGQLAQRLAGQRHSAKSVAFAGDGSRLAAGGGDRHVSLWNLPDGEHRQLPLKVDGGHSVALSDNGKWLACNANFPRKLNGALVWRLDRPAAPLELQGHVGQARVVAFVPGAQPRLVTGDDQGAIVVWDLTTSQALLKFQAHDQQINAVALSRDGSLLATGAHDGTVCVWDFAAALLAGRRGPPSLVTRFADHPREVRSVAFSPDGALIASGGGGPTVNVWDARSGQVRYTLGGHGYAVTAVAFSPQGETVATANWDGDLSLWELASSAMKDNE